MAAVAGIIGAVVSAGASLLSGVAAMNQANYQAQVAEMNEDIAKDNARRTILRGQLEQQEQDIQTMALLGEQQAAMSASGLSLGGRSFSKVRQSARVLGRLDALNVRQAADLEAYAYRTDAANYAAQAEASRMEAQSSLLGGFLGAAGSVAGAFRGGPSLIGGATKTRASSRYGSRSLLR